jgi:hypothetical protein
MNRDTIITMFSNLFEKIIGKHEKYIFNILKDQLQSNYIYKHLYLIDGGDNIPYFIIKTINLSNNLHYCDKLIDNIIHNIDYAIFSKIDLKYITHINKKNYLNINNDISFLYNNWKNINIYENYLGIYTILIRNKNQTILLSKFTIADISQNNTFFTENLEMKDNIPYHCIIFNNKYKKIIAYDDNLIQLNKHIKILYEESNEINNCQIKRHYSCVDELLFEYEQMEYKNTVNKKLIFGGYIIEYNNKIYLLESLIYRNLINEIDIYDNINISYLSLYCNNKLNNILPYFSIYYLNIIKRINESLKTIAKELLNIYHITRNKQSTNIYNCLPNNYKRILFDLHTIFIKSRKIDTYLDNEFIEKKSLSIDDVYFYLKNRDIDLLVTIYLSRNNIIKTIENNDINIDNIFYKDCVNTTTQIELIS